MSRHGIDAGGWQGSWPDPDQKVIKLTAELDPVPPNAREESPGIERQARDLESRVEIEAHIETEDEPLDPEDRQWPQRIYYVEWPPGWAPPQRGKQLDPGHVTAGFVYWQAGSWWWRPSWRGVDDPSVLDLGVNEPPSVELKVDSESDALEHARRRVAWVAAVRHAEYLAGDD